MICEVLLPTQQEINQNPMAIYKSRHFVVWGIIEESYQVQGLNRCDKILVDFV